MKTTLILTAMLIVVWHPLIVVSQDEETDAPESGVVIISPDKPAEGTEGEPKPEPEEKFTEVMVPVPIPKRDTPPGEQVPIGSVVAWLKSMPGTPALPDGWVECNGQTVELSGSPYQGRTVPNLNGANEEPQRFLRGSTASGAEGGKETHDHGPSLVQRTGDRRVNVGARRPVKHLPPYYEVTWIMRVR